MTRYKKAHGEAREDVDDDEAKNPVILKIRPKTEEGRRLMMRRRRHVPKTSEAEARKGMCPRQTIGTPSSVAPPIEEVRSRKSQGIARVEEERLEAPVEASTPGSEQESHKGSFQLLRTPQEKTSGRGTTRLP